MTFHLLCANCGHSLGSGSHDQKRDPDGKYVLGEILTISLGDVQVEPPVIEHHHIESLSARLAAAEAQVAAARSNPSAIAATEAQLTASLSNQSPTPPTPES